MDIAKCLVPFSIQQNKLRYRIGGKTEKQKIGCYPRDTRTVCAGKQTNQMKLCQKNESSDIVLRGQSIDASIWFKIF